VRATAGLAGTDQHHCGAGNEMSISAVHSLHDKRNDQEELAYDNTRPPVTAGHWLDDRDAAKH